jgi:hypothetical protein
MRLLASILSLAILLAPRAQAQLLRPSGVVASHAPYPSQLFAVREEGQVPRWPFVVVGAVAGGTAGGIWAASLPESDGPGFPTKGQLAVVAVAGGMIGGAISGLIVGQIVRIIRR